MKGIEALIKIQTYELDQKRHVLRQLEDVRAAIEQALVDLKSELSAEQNAARHSDEGNFIYGGYARRVIVRRETLQRSLVEATKQVEAAREDVARTFEGLKKFEITKTERDNAEQVEASRRENTVLDELGMNAYVRRKAE